MPDRRIIFVKLGCNLLQLVIHFQKILNIKRIFRNSEVRSPLQKCHKFLRTVKMDTAEKLKIHRYRHIDEAGYKRGGKPAGMHPVFLKHVIYHHRKDNRIIQKCKSLVNGKSHDTEHGIADTLHICILNRKTNKQCQQCNQQHVDIQSA